jgi:uncharacterized DUF497 family protein
LFLQRPGSFNPDGLGAPSFVHLSQNKPQVWLFKMVYFWYHLISMRIDWDDDKSDKLKRERGLSFEEVSVVIEGPHPIVRKTDDPEQYLAIGFAKDKLVTVIHEFREDVHGEYIWLVTYWKATKAEVKIYEKFRKG